MEARTFSMPPRTDAPDDSDFFLPPPLTRKDSAFQIKKPLMEHPLLEEAHSRRISFWEDAYFQEYLQDVAHREITDMGSSGSIKKKTLRATRSFTGRREPDKIHC